MKRYSLAALGGTFDHFHKGHQSLLTHAYSCADKVIIGITQDFLITHKPYPESIEPYEKRLKAVTSFIQHIDKLSVTTFIPLADIFGPTLQNPDIDCLVVSPLTKSGAVFINQTRKQRNLKPLPVKICHLEKDENKEHISSTRIRQGLINREGNVYANLLNNDIILTDKQKQKTKSPFGKLFSNPKRKKLHSLLNPSLTNVAIGDLTCHYCLKHNLPIKTFIFDNQTNREKLSVSVQGVIPFSNVLECSNKMGQIEKVLSQTLQHAFANQFCVKINGEEDLAVIPSVLLLPLGGTILYGQPKKGIVVVTITEEKKEWIKTLLQCTN